MISQKNLSRSFAISWSPIFTMHRRQLQPSPSSFPYRELIKAFATGCLWGYVPWCPDTAKSWHGSLGLRHRSQHIRDSLHHRLCRAPSAGSVAWNKGYCFRLTSSWHMNHQLLLLQWLRRSSNHQSYSLLIRTSVHSMPLMSSASGSMHRTGCW